MKPFPQPQPDYSVGFRKSAFSDEQSEKLRVLVGSGIDDDIDSAFFVATHRMYFPFVACAVKSPKVSLTVADRQNAHSMTLALRGFVQLYRLVKREKELHGEILRFSISHDNRSVRLYGHYFIFEKIKFSAYRHYIHGFDLTALNGKEKWTAYKFTRNIYDIWMPIQHKRICSAIDDLPSGVDFSLSRAATFILSTSEASFKKPDLPPGKNTKSELSSLKDRLTNQEWQSKEQIAEIGRLQEQMAQQREQMTKQEKEHKERAKEREKEYKEQIDWLKQLLDRRDSN